MTIRAVVVIVLNALLCHGGIATLYSSIPQVNNNRGSKRHEIHKRILGEVLDWVQGLAVVHDEKSLRDTLHNFRETEKLIYQGLIEDKSVSQWDVLDQATSKSRARRRSNNNGLQVVATDGPNEEERVDETQMIDRYFSRAVWLYSAGQEEEAARLFGNAVHMMLLLLSDATLSRPCGEDCKRTNNNNESSSPNTLIHELAQQIPSKMLEFAPKAPSLSPSWVPELSTPLLSSHLVMALLLRFITEISKDTDSLEETTGMEDNSVTFLLRSRKLALTLPFQNTTSTEGWLVLVGIGIAVAAVIFVACYSGYRFFRKDSTKPRKGSINKKLSCSNEEVEEEFEEEEQRDNMEGVVIIPDHSSIPGSLITTSVGDFDEPPDMLTAQQHAYHHSFYEYQQQHPHASAYMHDPRFYHHQPVNHRVVPSPLPLHHHHPHFMPPGDVLRPEPLRPGPLRPESFQYPMYAGPTSGNHLPIIPHVDPLMNEHEHAVSTRAERNGLVGASPVNPLFAPRYASSPSVLTPTHDPRLMTPKSRQLQRNPSERRPETPGTRRNRSHHSKRPSSRLSRKETVTPATEVTTPMWSSPSERSINRSPAVWHNDERVELVRRKSSSEEFSSGDPRPRRPSSAQARPISRKSNKAVAPEDPRLSDPNDEREKRPSRRRSTEEKRTGKHEPSNPRENQQIAEPARKSKHIDPSYDRDNSGRTRSTASRPRSRMSAATPEGVRSTRQASHGDAVGERPRSKSRQSHNWMEGATS